MHQHTACIHRNIRAGGHQGLSQHQPSHEALQVLYYADGSRKNAGQYNKYLKYLIYVLLL